MARISNSLSPARKGDIIVIETAEARYYGTTIRMAKADMRVRNNGIVTAENFRVWSVHPQTVWDSVERRDPFPKPHAATLLQENEQKRIAPAATFEHACPFCKAPPGQACSNKDGEPLYGRPHVSRVALLKPPVKKRRKIKKRKKKAKKK